MVDTLKELGWAHVDDDRPVTPRKRAVIEAAERKHEFLPPRSFNTVTVSNDVVIKSSAHSGLRGEKHFYCNLPAELVDLFPKLISAEEVNDDGALLISITMSHINGIPYSKLLVNAAVTPQRLRKVLEALSRMHAFGGAHSSQGKGKGKSGGESVALMYENYGAKLTQRFDAHKAIYEEIAHESSNKDEKFDVKKIYETLKLNLLDFEKQKRGKWAEFIHGDPVFSNILLTNMGEVTFVDMRGMLGEHLSTGGDVHYDLAKLLQSLMGYDLLLLGDVDESEAVAWSFLNGLRSVFWTVRGNVKIRN